ncbi:MAG: hypothetical protein IJ786_04655, partial [Bacteroidaceae bacterium]|nr:hypothetical protein [Bacteroidaceae bacterium]
YRPAYTGELIVHTHLRHKPPPPRRTLHHLAAPRFPMRRSVLHLPQPAAYNILYIVAPAPQNVSTSPPILSQRQYIL